MHAVRTFLTVSVAALATACASPGATNNPPVPPATASMDAGTPGLIAATDPRMKTMQEMHQKMMSAKTPADRQALMADHMKAMQGGMAMMKDMQGPGRMDGIGAMCASPMGGMGEGKGMPPDMAKQDEMMADHMAMMQMMMDMMGDRMPPAATTQ